MWFFILLIKNIIYVADQISFHCFATRYLSNLFRVDVHFK